ncbi:quinon protein alcohol dehydrogenase-like superfamily [Rostrohypoxylon terebratum]|nr:quinon protein alcohol dehydrogenase-like superfamily [Rostrohypoxylon terebratum]
MAFGGDSRLLLATGSDDGCVNIWDMNFISSNDNPLANSRPASVSERKHINQSSDPETGNGPEITDEALKDQSESDETCPSSSRPAPKTSQSRVPLYKLVGHNEPINSVAFSPDSTLVASGSDDGVLCTWQLDVNKPGDQIGTCLNSGRKRINSVTSSNGVDGYVVASCTEREIDIWDPKTNKRLSTMKSLSQELLTVAFSPSGGYLATGSYDNGVYLWCISVRPDEPGPELEPAGTLAKSIQDLALSPNGRTLAVAQSDGDIYLWDIKTDKQLDLHIDSHHIRVVLSVSFSPKDGALLLSSSKDGSVGVYDVDTGKQRNWFQGHTDWVRFSTWSPEQDYVASASDDGTVCIWKIDGEDAQKPQILTHDSVYVMGVAFSCDGKRIATCDTNGKTIVWAIKEDESCWHRVHTLEGTPPASCVIFSPDSRKVLIGSGEEIITWQMDTDRQLGVVSAGFGVRKMWLDKDLPNYVMTPYKAVSLIKTSSETAQTPSRSPYWCKRTVVGKKVEYWIMWHDRKVLFIPERFQPSSCGIFGHTVVIGTWHGRVYVYRFSEVEPPSTLKVR